MPAPAKLAPLCGADRGTRARAPPGVPFPLDQDLLFRLQPVLAIVTVLKTPVFKQLIGAPGDQLVELPIIQERRFPAWFLPRHPRLCPLSHDALLFSRQPLGGPPRISCARSPSRSR